MRAAVGEQSGGARDTSARTPATSVDLSAGRGAGVSGRVSVLFPPGADGLPDRSVAGRPASSDTLKDLALDGVVERVAGAVAPELRDVLATPLTDERAVRYRQAVVVDLREPQVRAAVGAFDEQMRLVAARRGSAVAARSAHQRVLWLCHAAAGYVAAVDRLATDLAQAVAERRASSPAMTAFAEHVARYQRGTAFGGLRDHTARVEAGLAEARYAVWLRGPKITVAPPGDEPDLQQLVLETFERFRQQSRAAHGRSVSAGPDLDHVQAQILDRVALLLPDLFADAAALADAAAAQVPDPTITAVSDELAVYVAYLDLVAPAERAGLPTCLPEVSSGSKEMSVRDAWDLPLGLDLVADRLPVVTNDLELRGPERVLVVSGPNQGGKTTTARTFGQLHHLAAVGLPVAGRDARLMLADQVLTVFEREETSAELDGRLGGELVRVHRVLDGLTPRTVVVLNEVFASTAVEDARFLGREVLERLIAADVPTVLVTFVDELSRLGPATVSMVSLVDPDDPTVRTLKVVRRAADGRAYADALATRYGLSHDRIVARVVR